MEAKLEKLHRMYSPDRGHGINRLIAAATQVASSSLEVLITFAPGPGLGIFFGRTCVSICTLGETTVTLRTIIPNLLILESSHIFVRPGYEEAERAVLYGQF